MIWVKQSLFYIAEKKLDLKYSLKNQNHGLFFIFNIPVKDVCVPLGYYRQCFQPKFDCPRTWLDFALCRAHDFVLVLVGIINILLAQGPRHYYIRGWRKSVIYVCMVTVFYLLRYWQRISYSLKQAFNFHLKRYISALGHQVIFSFIS